VPTAEILAVAGADGYVELRLAAAVTCCTPLASTVCSLLGARR
jgi:hypothetical protein